MTIEQLMVARGAVPFRPFTLRMADGQMVPVTRPEFISRSPSGLTVIVSHGNDITSILDLLLMTEIEYDAPTPKLGKRSRN